MIIMAITIVILLASLASLVLLDSEHPCPMGIGEGNQCNLFPDLTQQTLPTHKTKFQII